MSFTKKAEKKGEMIPSPLQDKLDDVLEAIEEGIIPTKIAQAYKQRINNAQVNFFKDKEDHVFKARLNLEMGIDAYLFALENGATPDDALAYTQKLHDLTDEFIKEAKNNKYMTSKTAREVVRAHDTHPRQKRMREQGTLDRGALVDSKTPNQQLRRLHNQTLLDEQLNFLLEDNKEKGIRIEVIEETLRRNGLTIDRKEVCQYLKNKGYTYKELAEYYRVSQSTVKRWMKL